MAFSKARKITYQGMISIGWWKWCLSNQHVNDIRQFLNGQTALYDSLHIFLKSFCLAQFKTHFRMSSIISLADE